MTLIVHFMRHEMSKRRNGRIPTNAAVTFPHVKICRDYPKNTFQMTHPKSLSVPAKVFVLIVPVLVIVISSPGLMSAHGPFYLAFNLDPDYAYLFNSLLLLHFQAPAHIDHPGTTLQLLGAGVIFLRHLFLNRNVELTDLTFSVLKDPEGYLFAIHRVLIGIVAASFAFASLKFAQRRGVAMSLVFQAVCAGFVSVTQCLVRVTPEPLLLAASLLAVALLQEETDDGRIRIGNAIALGIVLGFGVVTKITFIPICISVLIIRDRYARVVATLLMILSVPIFSAPILGQYSRFMDWMGDLFVHDKRYGKGLVGLPAVSAFFDNLQSLFKAEPLIFILMVEFGIWILVWGIRRIRNPGGPSHLSDRALFTGACVLLMQGVLTLKHPAPHYLLPVMILAAWLHLLLLQRSQSPENKWTPGAGTMLAITLIVVGISAWSGITSSLQEMRERKSDARDLATAVSQRSCRVAGSYRSSVPEYALWFGSLFSRSTFGNELAVLYPDTLVYSFNKLYSYGGAVRNPNVDLKPCILLQTTPILTKPRISLKPLLVRSEILYAVTFPEKP